MDEYHEITREYASKSMGHQNDPPIMSERTVREADNSFMRQATRVRHATPLGLSTAEPTTCKLLLLANFSAIPLPAVKRNTCSERSELAASAVSKLSTMPRSRLTH